MMTKGEREELAKLVRERAKLGKTMAAERAAELLADAEQDMALRQLSYSALRAFRWEHASSPRTRRLPHRNTNTELFLPKPKTRCTSICSMEDSFLTPHTGYSVTRL